MAETPAQWLEANWKRHVVGPDLPAFARNDPEADRVGGIYFLWAEDGKLLYIGSTDDTAMRIAQHIWARKIPFASFSVLEVDPLPHEWALIARRIEQCYIRALRPPYNRKTQYTFRQGPEMEAAILEAWKCAEVVEPLT